MLVLWFGSLAAGDGVGSRNAEEQLGGGLGDSVWGGGVVWKKLMFGKESLLRSDPA